MDRAYTEIGRPEHEFGAVVDSPDTYRGHLLQTLRDLVRRFPRRPWGSPHQATTTSAPFVNHGIWKLACPCGDHPVYSPEWRLACCFRCGAVYESVEPPVDYLEIERLLLQRPLMAQRNWTQETLDDLRAENVAHGDPV